MTAATWLPMRRSITSMVMSLAVRHGDDPSVIAAALADVFPQGEGWERLAAETGRVLDAVKRGEG